MGQERALSEDLTKLSEALTKWRAEHGGRGKRIPEEFWSEAVRVARTDGLWLTAKMTRFNYHRLKKRSGQADGDGVPGAMRPPPANEHRVRRRRARRRGETEFVELGAPQVIGAPMTVVEVENKAGTRMIVRLTHEVPIGDVAKLISAFGRRDA